MRRVEVAGPQSDNVHLESGTLEVKVTRIVLDYKVVVSEPKSEKSERRIALDPWSVQVLERYRRQQAAERLAAGLPWSNPEGYVFVNELGEPYHPQRISQMFKLQSSHAGLPAKRLHDLRHGYASSAIAAGVDLKLISERLGRPSLSITSDTYGHIEEAVDRRAAEQAAAYIFGTATS